MANGKAANIPPIPNGRNEVPPSPATMLVRFDASKWGIADTKKIASTAREMTAITTENRIVASIPMMLSPTKIT